jgi:hypothetical protein
MEEKEEGHPTMAITSIQIFMNAIVVDVKLCIMVAAVVVQAATLIQLKVQKNYWKAPSLKL